MAGGLELGGDNGGEAASSDDDDMLVRMGSISDLTSGLGPILRRGSKTTHQNRLRE
jgi:hypothetical protein